MPNDLCILHYRIPDHSDPTGQDQAAAAGTVAKNGTHEWRCQLSVLEDKSTIRGTLGTLSTSEASNAEFLSCCSLQVAALQEFEPETIKVFLNKRVRSEDLFKRGIEFYLDREDVWLDKHYEFYIILSSYPIKLLGPPDGAHWTHSLVLSECDPIARNFDPLVEMMTRFEQHSLTSDVECRFVSKAGLVLDCMRAHHAILSIYPVFCEKMAKAQRNPHQRSTATVLLVPVERWAAFGRMLGYIYSGRLPREGFAPRSDQWKTSYELAKEHGLEKCNSSIPWMEWHLRELKQVITNENVLEIYFGWGYEHGTVAQMCIRYVADRSQIHFHGKDLGTYVMGLLKERYQGQKGCHEFQEALVALLMEMYAEQQQQQQQHQQQPNRIQSMQWTGECSLGRR
ncbi:hypothetical protein BGZ65_007049 [Modicella reniformis]|uniref:BTB domain-containing protein n=1 Tax=Modicella reniformis TaxID=1440133 RepID=A0A9P6LU69_9FUNG|nr:hypothetical protein BGZ65_007049 [Modicella reniformis]